MFGAPGIAVDGGGAPHYELAPGVTRVVTLDHQNLSVQRSGRAAETLIPEAPDIFFRKGIEGRILFRRDATGRVDALVDRRNNEDIVWKRMGKRADVSSDTAPV